MQQWLIFLAQIGGGIAGIVLAVHVWRYLRAWIKRERLLGRLKRICDQNGYAYTVRSGFRASLLCRGSIPAMDVQTPDACYHIHFYTCLRRKKTYVFNQSGGYYTTSNFNPILVSFRHPSSGLVHEKPAERRLYLSPFVKLKNNFIADNHKKGGIVPAAPAEGEVPLLCFHPAAIGIEAIRTNRAEPVYDGDVLFGYTVYSGKALCDFLKNKKSIHIDCVK